MPLVQVDDPGLDSEGVERSDPADPEQCVLGLAGAAVPDVELCGDPAVEGGVLGSFGIEEKERHPAQLDAPDLCDDLPPPNRDGYRHREVVRVRDERGRQPLGIGVDPVLVLPSRLIDPLEEVALAVEQADRDQRQRAVRGGLEEIARQGAEPAPVDRERTVHSVLGAQKRDGPVRRKRSLGEGARAIRRNGLLDGRSSCQQVRVLGRAHQRVGGSLLEQAHRVLAALLPAVRIDTTEDLGAAGNPRPAVVEGEPGQHRQGSGKPGRQSLRRALEIFVSRPDHDGSIYASGWQKRDDWKGLASGWQKRGDRKRLARSQAEEVRTRAIASAQRLRRSARAAPSSAGSKPRGAASLARQSARLVKTPAPSPAS